MSPKVTEGHTRSTNVTIGNSSKFDNRVHLIYTIVTKIPN